MTFEPLAKLRAVHLGLFWSHINSAGEFPTVTELNPGPADIEAFPAAKEAPELDLSFLDRPMVPRAIFTSAGAGEHQIAVQPDELQVSWRQVAEGKYPRWEDPSSFFQGMLQSWRSFVEDQDLGTLGITQVEVSYENTLPSGAVWLSPQDLASVVKLSLAPGRPGSMEDFHYSDHFRIETSQGPARMHLSFFTNEPRDDDPIARLLLLYRCPLRAEGGDIAVADALEEGHHAIVSTFVAVTTETAHNLWGLIE